MDGYKKQKMKIYQYKNNYLFNLILLITIIFNLQKLKFQNENRVKYKGKTKLRILNTDKNLNSITKR